MTPPTSAPTSPPLQPTKEHINNEEHIFASRSSKSKEKILRFFGEPQLIPLVSGRGNIEKLKSFYGLSAINHNHHHAHDHQPDQQSQSVDAVLDLPLAGKTRSRADSDLSLASLSLETLDKRSSLSARRWSAPSSPAVDGSSAGSKFTYTDITPASYYSYSSSSSSATLTNERTSTTTNPTSTTHQPLEPPTSIRKLASLLGQPRQQIDIPLSQILQPTSPPSSSSSSSSSASLHLLLQSKLPLLYFLSYLLQSHTPELLLFPLDVHSFQSTLFPSTVEQNRHATRIFGEYLAPKAALEINVTHKARRAVIGGVQRGERACFAAAEAEVLVLLEQAFEKFKKSGHSGGGSEVDVWDAMQKSIGGSSSEGVVITEEKIQYLKRVIVDVLGMHYLGSEEAMKNTKRNTPLREKVPALLLSKIGLAL
ncbi:hypothetical protein HDV05_002314 [Chytridiales sp. JEL 0842]|nr:hypothetical protein HDV05_002314 [Chytridiales sp. JEL 0842]